MSLQDTKVLQGAKVVMLKGEKGDPTPPTDAQVIEALGEVGGQIVTPWMDTHGADAIDSWLDAHPEATTTVQDNSLTYNKLVKGTLGFVTPEMFGAVGDGVTDDTQAWQTAIDFALQNNIEKVLCSKRKYYLSNALRIDGHDLSIDGCGASLIFNGSGFGISSASFNIIIQNMMTHSNFEKGSSAPSAYNFGVAGSTSDAEYLAHDITFSNIKMSGGVFGVTLNSAKNVRIEQCSISDYVYKPVDSAGGYGVLIQSSINVVIDQCDFDMGKYGRHDVYVSVDPTKLDNIESKRVTVSNCSFNHSHLEMDGSGHYYSPNTPCVMVRSCKNLVIENCTVYSATGFVAMTTENGNIENVSISNLLFDTPVYNSGSSEIRSCIACTNNGDYFAECQIDNVSVINSPNEYTQFLDGHAFDLQITNCNIGPTRLLIYNNTHLEISNIITEISEYFIRFYGNVTGFVRNIIFKNDVAFPYYLDSSSVVSNNMFDADYLMPIRYTTGSTVLDNVSNGLRAGSLYERLVNFGNIHPDLGGAAGVLNGFKAGANAEWQEFRSVSKMKKRLRNGGNWGAWTDL